MIVQDLIKKVLKVSPLDFVIQYGKINGIEKDDEKFVDFLERTLYLLDSMTQIEPEKSDMVILGVRSYYEFDDEYYIDTSAYKKEDLMNWNDNCDVAVLKNDALSFDEKVKFMSDHHLPTAYAYEFNNWSETLGYEVSEKNLAMYSPVDILADIINEMTFFGDEEGMLDQKEIIDERIAETEAILALPEEEQAEHFVSMNNFFDSIGYVDERTEKEKADDTKKVRDAMIFDWIEKYEMLKKCCTEDRQ